MSGITYGDKSNIWYSPAIGNIIKVDFKNVELGFGYLLKKFTMDLLSTTYQSLSNPPGIPSDPNGPTNVIAGEAGAYETVTTDPDGNKIRYVFDWGDGSTKTYTDFVNSGDTVIVSHTWTKKGNHEIRVKARDKYGWESKWSDPLNVIVVNNKPNKPSTPDGAINGEIKKSYPYTTSTLDPDGHRVRFGFDWDGDNQVDDWTGFVNSTETAIKSYTWYNKGSYEIKVKAQDEYGEESNWSDPLSVSIPKQKFINNLFQKFFEKHPLIIPFLRYIQKIIGD